MTAMAQERRFAAGRAEWLARARAAHAWMREPDPVRSECMNAPALPCRFPHSCTRANVCVGAQADAFAERFLGAR